MDKNNMDKCENCIEHSAHCARIARAENDIQELWKVADVIREEIKKVLIKMSWLFGVLAAVNAVIMVIVQIAMKNL